MCQLLVIRAAVPVSYEIGCRDAQVIVGVC